MLPIPVRDLAKGGIVRDVHTTAMPPSYWSNGHNVVFENGNTLRSPIWRNVMPGLGSNVRFCAALTPASGFDQVAIARDDGSLALYANKTITEASETGFTAKGYTSAPWTACLLGDVLHINRQDTVPRTLLPTRTQFQPMPNWDSTWRCRALRQFNDGLVALNVTKGATATPSMVKVSDITYYGAAPRSWDSTDPTTLAYENPLAQLDGPITDGFKLGDRFLFYTAHQCWEMRADAQNDYAFRLVEAVTDGAIATNCIVAVNGLHYVFGTKDMYCTDGNSVRNLGEGRNREWIYRTLNVKLANQFFACYVQKTNEILFAYVSGDPACAWNTPTGCNNGALYNITSDTWSFVDLPNVSMMTLCNVDCVLTPDTAGDRTIDGTGGSFYDQEDSRELHLVGVNQPLNTKGSTTVITGGMLLGYDFVDRGQLAYEVATDCLAPSFVERTGIALDQPEVGSAPLVIDKEVQAVYPEVTISRPVSVSVQLGGQMTPSGIVTWEAAQPFDPTVDYKVDSRASGRYLAIRFMFDPMADTEVSGFDIEVIANGSR